LLTFWKDLKNNEYRRKTYDFLRNSGCDVASQAGSKCSNQILNLCPSFNALRTDSVYSIFFRKNIQGCPGKNKILSGIFTSIPIAEITTQLLTPGIQVFSLP